MNIPREGGARMANCLLRNKGSPAGAREGSPSLPPQTPWVLPPCQGSVCTSFLSLPPSFHCWVLLPSYTILKPELFNYSKDCST